MTEVFFVPANREASGLRWARVLTGGGGRLAPAMSKIRVADSGDSIGIRHKVGYEFAGLVVFIPVFMYVAVYLYGARQIGSQYGLPLSALPVVGVILTISFVVHYMTKCYDVQITSTTVKWRRRYVPWWRGSGDSSDWRLHVVKAFVGTRGDGRHFTLVGGNRQIPLLATEINMLERHAIQDQMVGAISRFLEVVDLTQPKNE